MAEVMQVGIIWTKNEKRALGSIDGKGRTAHRVPVCITKFIVMIGPQAVSRNVICEFNRPDLNGQNTFNILLPLLNTVLPFHCVSLQLVIY